MPVYAGVGKRMVPQAVLRECRRLGEYLAKLGWTLRSGGADGCDLAFEVGCDLVNGDKEIYLVERLHSKLSNWAEEMKINPRPEGRTFEISPLAYDIAMEHHPVPDRLGYYAKQLMARNSHIVLGADLQSPVDMLVCYLYPSARHGGTKQSVRLANHYGIPVFNLLDQESVAEVERYGRLCGTVENQG